MNIVVIPTYNDWKSLDKLLFLINQNLNSNNIVKVLIVDDKSTQKMKINLKKFDKIKEITTITNNKNLGSQKSIAIGLSYLKKFNNNFYITVMDSDGEDNPSEIKKMLTLAKKNKDHIIVSSRKKRQEKLFFKFCYKIHLTIFFLFTGNWISFGNFSCFNSKNLKKIISNNNIWYAYSAGILKNNKIIKTYASKKKRYFDKSKLSYMSLIEHGIRILGVFKSRILIITLVFFIFTFKFYAQPLVFSLYFILLLLNLLILLVFYKNHLKGNINYLDFTDNIKTLKTKLN